MNTLIKNGLIFDGRGQPPYKKDILIKGERIYKIGEIDKSKADQVIDAEGAYVFSGFIDINSGIDHHLKILTEPHQKSFIEQGVTTVIGGNSGSSLAPIFGNSLETIKKWGAENLSKINIDWQQF